MFNMYRRRFYPRSRLHGHGSEEELGHDRFNYMNPTVNYDKWPRRLRPKKNSLKVELEAPESPHLHEQADGIGPAGSAHFPSSSTHAGLHQRHCHGSLREHQRLLNLRSSRHKCSPRCRVKSPKSSSPTLSTEALVKVFACLGVQDGPAGGAAVSYLDKHKGCPGQPSSAQPQFHHHAKRPKRLNVFSASFSSIRYSSSRMKDGGVNSGSNSNGSVALDGPMMNMAGGGAGGNAVSGIELYEMENRTSGTSSGHKMMAGSCMLGSGNRISDSREMATNICRQYIRSSSRYLLLDHLQDIGSRIDKQWFLIRDATLKTERLLTIVPLNGSASYGCDVTTSDADATRNALVDLFTALQHPYIYPVLDVDFVYGAVASSNASYVEEAKPVLVTVFPFNSKGSLKDLIYRSRWQDDWGQKYRQRSEGLPLLQVQRLGRQILEALLFLQERGFPPFGHLHSGNVIIQNGVARLTGYENTLLGFSSRIHPLVKSILPGIPAAVDTICFGHVLFEMCSGYELYAPKPTARHLEDLQSYPQVVEVLDYIFNPSEDYPSIGNLAILEFFRNIDLREMRCSTIYYNAKLTSAALSLLEQVQQKRRRREKQQQKQQRQQQHQQHLSPKLDSGTSVTSSEIRQVDIHYIREEEQQRSDEDEGSPPSSATRQRAASTTLAYATVVPAPTDRRPSDLHLQLVSGGNGPLLRTGRLPLSSTSPSLSLLQLAATDPPPTVSYQVPQDPGQIPSNIAQSRCYCSDESFQTPLETPTSPGADREYLLFSSHQHGHPIVATLMESDGKSQMSSRPRLVLTPPDLNDAFNIDDSIHCQ